MCLKYLLAIFVLAEAGVSQAVACPKTEEEAAMEFVRRAVVDPRGITDLLEAKSMATYRARLQQLMDERYSPRSAEFRKNFFGEGSSVSTIKELSDVEFLQRYSDSSTAKRGQVDVADISVTAVDRRVLYGIPNGTYVTIRYLIKTPEGDNPQERILSTEKAGDCWLVEMPVESWARVRQIADKLKSFRQEFEPSRKGESKVKIIVAAASRDSSPGMKRLKQRKGEGRDVWVSNTPLATEKDILGANASWDCSATGFAPEDPSVQLYFSDHGARALKAWTKENMNSMIAIVIGGEVFTFATVKGIFGERISVCLDGESLEDAQNLAERISGVSH